MGEIQKGRPFVIEPVEASELLPKLEGAVIAGCEMSEDGLHLSFADGRVLIFCGAFVVAIFQEERVIQ